MLTKEESQKNMKCEICGIPYKSYYPESREVEQQCTCCAKQQKKCWHCGNEVPHYQVHFDLYYCAHCLDMFSLEPLVDI